MSCHQIEFIGAYVASVEGVSSVQIEDRGAHYFAVTLFDGEGEEFVTKLVFPSENKL